MPSSNRALPDDAAYLDAVPQAVSRIAETIMSNELFFIVYILIYL